MAFSGGVARLGRRVPYSFEIRHGYRLVDGASIRGSWQITTTNYWYHLLDKDERIVVAYHWHPVGRSRVAYPHLHVGGPTASVDLSKAHLPTGPVALPAVIRMTITEFGVEPLRPDWEDVLARVERTPTV